MSHLISSSNTYTKGSISLSCYSYSYSQFFFYWRLRNRGVKNEGGFGGEFQTKKQERPQALALDSGTGLSQFLLQPWGKSSVNVSSARKMYFCSAVWSAESPVDFKSFACLWFFQSKAILTWGSDSFKFICHVQSLCMYYGTISCLEHPRRGGGVTTSKENVHLLLYERKMSLRVSSFLCHLFPFYYLSRDETMFMLSG